MSNQFVGKYTLFAKRSLVELDAVLRRMHEGEKTATFHSGWENPLGESGIVSFGLHKELTPEFGHWLTAVGYADEEGAGNGSGPVFRPEVFLLDTQKVLSFDAWLDFFHADLAKESEACEVLPRAFDVLRFLLPRLRVAKCVFEALGLIRGEDLPEIPAQPSFMY